MAARARLATAWLAGCAASTDPLSPGAGDLTAHFAEETPPVVGSGAEPAPGPDVSFELESFALGLRASHRAAWPLEVHRETHVSSAAHAMRRFRAAGESSRSSRGGRGVSPHGRSAGTVAIVVAAAGGSASGGAASGGASGAGCAGTIWGRRRAAAAKSWGS